MLPNEKNALRALPTFSMIGFVGLRFGVHHVPRHLEAWDGSKDISPTSTEMVCDWVYTVCMNNQLTFVSIQL